MLVYGKCECFVMQMLYVYVLCASCGSSQCCVLHDLQFVNAGHYHRPSHQTCRFHCSVHLYPISLNLLHLLQRTNFAGK